MFFGYFWLREHNGESTFNKSTSKDLHTEGFRFKERIITVFFLFLCVCVFVVGCSLCWGRKCLPSVLKQSRKLPVTCQKQVHTCKVLRNTDIWSQHFAIYAVSKLIPVNYYILFIRHYKKNRHIRYCCISLLQLGDGDGFIFYI